MSSVTLTGNFLATARCLTFSDSAGISWSFDVNTNTLVPSLTGAGIVSAVDGTAGQIDTSTVGSVVTVSIDAGYVGQTSITTLGTITTGTWEGTAIGTGYLPASQTQLTTAANLVTVGTITTGVWDGTTIAIAHGGTGQTTAAAAFAALSPLTTAGDLLYETTAPAPDRLPIGANTYILTSDGTVPVWTAPPVIPTGANPTGTVGLSAVNGTATTFLRSDGAPALSQAITPTWTGAHVFSSTVEVDGAFTVKVGGSTVFTVGGSHTYNLTLPAQSSGWGTPTGAAQITNFSGGSATLLQCSQTIAEILNLLLSINLYLA